MLLEFFFIEVEESNYKIYRCLPIIFYVWYTYNIGICNLCKTIIVALKMYWYIRILFDVSRLISLYSFRIWVMTNIV